MDWLPDLWTTVDRTEKIFSVIASVATVAVAIAAGSIRSAILSKTRLPEDHKALRKHVSDLRQALAALKKDQADLQDVRESISKIKGTLIGIQGKLSREHRKMTEHIILLIAQARVGLTHNDAFWDIYRELLTLIEAVGIYEKDARV